MAAREERPLRLGVDGRELRPGVRTGIGRYLLEIPALRGATQEDVERVLEPVLKALGFVPRANRRDPHDVHSCAVSRVRSTLVIPGFQNR